MITASGKYYLYRHIRLDTGEPFYIGIGQKEGQNRRKWTSEYRRAYAHWTRTPLWKQINNKAGREVEILMESDDKKFIEQKEVEFIAMYGRRDMGEGTLANMTNGGDYYPMPKKHHYKCANKFDKKRRLEIASNIKHPLINSNAKTIYLYERSTGKLIGEFKQVKDASKAVGISAVTLSVAAKNFRAVNEIMPSYFNYGEYCNPQTYIQNKPKSRKVYQIDPISKVVLRQHKSMTEAAKYVNANVANLWSAVVKKGMCANYYWSDTEEATIVPQKRRRSIPVIKIHPESNVVELFPSIKDAANNVKTTPSNIRGGIVLNTLRKGFYWKYQTGDNYQNINRL